MECVVVMTGGKEPPVGLIVGLVVGGTSLMLIIVATSVWLITKKR